MTLKRKFFFLVCSIQVFFFYFANHSRKQRCTTCLLTTFLYECIPLMDTYKWITNISTPYAYQIGTKRKNGRSKKDESLSKYLKMVIEHVQSIFLYSTAHICNENDFS